MKIDYGTWELSVKERMNILLTASSIGSILGWLFFDEILFGVGMGVGTGIYIKPFYCNWMIEKRKRQLLLQFQDLLYSLSSSISLGRSMGQALAESYGFWEGTYEPEDYIMVELKQFILSMEAGNESEMTLLKDFANRCGLTDVRDFVTVYGCCRESGGNLVVAMHRGSRIIGDKISLEHELHSLLVQKQFEGRIIMAAPMMILLFLKILAPEYLVNLTSSETGYFISAVALVLIGVAAFFMERVNHIDF